MCRVLAVSACEKNAVPDLTYTVVDQVAKGDKVVTRYTASGTEFFGVPGTCNRIEMSDGRDIEMGRGDLFEIGPGHDWVVIGDEPYVSTHFLGADQYATNG